MSNIELKVLSSTAPEEASTNQLAGSAALTEANRHVDIIHTSLAGMTAIVIVLLSAVALPVFGYAPVRHMYAFIIMVIAAMGGIGGLYYLNYRVHQHVSNQARLTEVLVNSLGQGFLSFDIKGVCGRVYSQACLDLIQSVPANKNIAEVLRIPEAQRGDFRDWLDILFMPNHALGFDDVVRFLPQHFPHTKGRRVSLMYRPIRNAHDVLTHMVVIATDQTDEYEAQQRMQQQQSYVDMICCIFKERNQFLVTITQIRKFLEAAAELPPRAQGAPLLRTLHTLKAAVKHFHMDVLGKIVSDLEMDLRGESITNDEQFRACLATGRKAMGDGLNTVLGQVRELIGHDYEGRGNMREVEESVIYAFAHEMQAKHVDPALVRRYLSAIAAVPINDCFHLFERELRDLAQITGKQVKPMRFTGSNPRVLTQPLQEFLLSLTHICRNIIDHGIEPSVTRLARGKDPSGQVAVHTDIALGEGGKEWLHIIISDDGNGIDPSRVRTKLAALEPQGNWRDEDDQAVIQHVFSWGFSTRDNITDLSGHGVGLEAVKREVVLLGGEIKVYSELYHSTRFDIRIPYSIELRDKTKNGGSERAQTPVAQAV